MKKHLRLFGLLLLFLPACEQADEAPMPETKPKAENPAATPEHTPAAEVPVENRAISILTASRSGNYYKAATELAGILGTTEYELDIRESPGSFANIGQLGSGKADLAIAQFDTIMVYMAMGQEHKNMANNSLVLAPLSSEVVHIVTHKKAKIKNFKDLVGKRIAVGPEHSGSWISAFNVMFYINKVNIEEEKKVYKMPYDQMMAKLVAGELDAVFATSAPGMPLLKNVDKRAAKKLSLLGVGKKFKLPKDLSWSYDIQEIPANTYPYQKKKVSALATRSFLLANRSLSSKNVEALAKVVYENAERLKAQGSLWKLVSTEMARKDIEDQYPYHDGVTKYLGASPKAP